jgi:hypothetical protein
MFRYYTGQTVLEGDRVLTEFRNEEGMAIDGVIELIVQPGSKESEWYQAPNGGVLIKVNWKNGPGLVMIGEQWWKTENLEFIEHMPRSTT